MKTALGLILLIMGIASCASSKTDFSIRNKIYFLSRRELIDVLSVKGIDLGKMYQPSSEAVSSKNVGKKGYTTYDGYIKEDLIIKWRPSKKDNASTREVKLKRPDDVPENLPENTSLVLEYMGNNSWKVYVYNGTMLH